MPTVLWYNDSTIRFWHFILFVRRMRLFALYREERCVVQFRFILCDSLCPFFCSGEEETARTTWWRVAQCFHNRSYLYNYEPTVSKVFYLSINIAFSTERLKFRTAYFWLLYANECYMGATNEGYLNQSTLFKKNLQKLRKQIFYFVGFNINPTMADILGDYQYPEALDL